MQKPAGAKLASRFSRKSISENAVQKRESRQCIYDDAMSRQAAQASCQCAVRCRTASAGSPGSRDYAAHVDFAGERACVGEAPCWQQAGVDNRVRTDVEQQRAMAQPGRPAVVGIWLGVPDRVCRPVQRREPSCAMIRKKSWLPSTLSATPLLLQRPDAPQHGR